MLGTYGYTPSQFALLLLLFFPLTFKGVGNDVPLVESLWDDIKQEAISMQVEPGISDYASDLDGLEASVNATPDIAHNTFQCARDDTGGARRCQFCYSR